MARTGRPRAEIDVKIFEKLCELQCTENEIASFFNVSHDTIERWCKRTYKNTFAYVYKQKAEGGRISLRRSQFRLAEHNPTMAIWLGKQYLGQKDAKDITVKQKIDSEAIEAVEGFLNGNG